MAGRISDRAGRSLGRQDWKAQYAELSALDRRTALEPADLERLGIVAYLAGDESGSIVVHTRAHNLALENRDTRHAARSAFWIAFALIGARELTRAAGWAARARRLLEEDRVDCVECGYVMLPQALECEPHRPDDRGRLSTRRPETARGSGGFQRVVWRQRTARATSRANRCTSSSVVSQEHIQRITDSSSSQV